MKFLSLRFQDPKVETAYQETRMPLTKNFLKHLIAVTLFFTIYSVIVAIVNNRAFVPNTNTFLLVLTLFLHKYHDRMKFIMEPIVVLISLILYGIGLKVVRVFFQESFTPVVFYIGYNFALFQRLIETRLVKSGSAMVLYLGFFVLRLTMISEWNIPALMIQILLEVLLLISNVERERNVRRLFRSFYDYKGNLEKFKDLITNYFPENIVIFNKDFTKTLFTNETFQKSFDVKAEENSENKAIDIINNFKIDGETIQGPPPQELQVGHQAPKTLGEMLKNFIGFENNDNKILTVNVRNSDQKPETQVYQTKVLKLFWDQDEANAVIFSDLTQQETIIALKIADANKDKVIATVSHELRSPINAILGFTNILEGMVVNRTPEASFYLSACKYSANWLLTLVNSILDLSQIRGKSLKLSPMSFNLAENLEEIKRMFGFQCDQKKLELIFDIAHDLPKAIFTDKNRLNQILINLLYNALKFTYKGSIKLKVRNSKTNPLKLKFRVADTGIGIKDDDKEKLFKMYGKVEQSDNKMNTQGVGLGLTISNELVHLLNPNKEISGIKCKSEWSRGSSFSFSIVKNLEVTGGTRSDFSDESPTVAVANQRKSIFPPEKEYKFMPASSPNLSDFRHSVSQPDDLTNGENKRSSFLFMTSHEKNKAKTEVPRRFLPDSTSPSTNSHLSFPPITTTADDKLRPWALVVDDMPFNLIVGSHLLKKKGFNVKTALNGEEAIKVVKEHCVNGKDFKLILMDLQMPVMDGFETTEILIKMMENKKIPKIPIVAFSANNSTKDIDKAKKAGMCEFLFKPLEEEQFDMVLVNHNIKVSSS